MPKMSLRGEIDSLICSRMGLSHSYLVEKSNFNPQMHQNVWNKLWAHHYGQCRWVQGSALPSPTWCTPSGLGFPAEVLLEEADPAGNVWVLSCCVRGVKEVGWGSGWTFHSPHQGPWAHWGPRLTLFSNNAIWGSPSLVTQRPSKDVCPHYYSEVTTQVMYFLQEGVSWGSGGPEILPYPPATGIMSQHFCQGGPEEGYMIHTPTPCHMSVEGLLAEKMNKYRRRRVRERRRLSRVP